MTTSANDNDIYGAQNSESGMEAAPHPPEVQPAKRLNLHITMPPPSRFSNSDVSGYSKAEGRCPQVVLKSLRQERYLKQRSLSNSPMLRFGTGGNVGDGFPEAGCMSSAAREAGPGFVGKFAETELQWNELKKDLQSQKSPRVSVVPQSSYYLHNSDKLRAKADATTIQNTNYNFYNYSINLGGCVSENVSSVLVPGTENSLPLKCSFSTPRDSSFTQSMILRGRKSGCSKFSPAVKSILKPKSSFRSSTEVGHTAAVPSNDKLLNMIMEVRANLEDCNRKRSITVEEPEDEPLQAKGRRKERQRVVAKNVPVEDAEQDSSGPEASEDADEDTTIHQVYVQPTAETAKPAADPLRGAVSDRHADIHESLRTSKDFTSQRKTAAPHAKLVRLNTVGKLGQSQKQVKSPRQNSHTAYSSPTNKLTAKRDEKKQKPSTFATLAANAEAAAKRRKDEVVSPTRSHKKETKEDRKGKVAGCLLERQQREEKKAAPTKKLAAKRPVTAGKLVATAKGRAAASPL